MKKQTESNQQWEDIQRMTCTQRKRERFSETAMQRCLPMHWLQSRRIAKNDKSFFESIASSQKRNEELLVREICIEQKTNNEFQRGKDKSETNSNWRNINFRNSLSTQNNELSSRSNDLLVKFWLTLLNFFVFKLCAVKMKCGFFNC